MTNMRAQKTAFALQALVGLGSGVGVGVALQPPSPGATKFANDTEVEFTEFTDNSLEGEKMEEDVNKNNGPSDGYEAEARSASFHQESEFTEFTVDVGVPDTQVRGGGREQRTDEEDVNNGPGDGYEVEALSASFQQETQKMRGACTTDTTLVIQKTDCLPCMVWLAKTQCADCRLCLASNGLIESGTQTDAHPACDSVCANSCIWGASGSPCRKFTTALPLTNCFAALCYTADDILQSGRDKANWLFGEKHWSHYYEHHSPGR